MVAKRFSGLDGIRGVAAIAVMLGHAEKIFGQFSIIAHYYLAVDLFFILSGFVIALNYEDRLKNNFGFKAFTIARGRRLLPTFWIGTTITSAAFFVCMYYHGLTTLELIPYFVAFALTLCLIPDVYPDPTLLYPTAPVTWSLFFEWVVNIAYARFGFRFSVRVLALIVVTSYAVVIVYASIVDPNAGFVGPDIPLRFWLYGSLRALGGFAIGVLIYRWSQKASFMRIPSVPQIIPLLLCVIILTSPRFLPLILTDSLIVVIGCPLIVVLSVRSEQATPGIYSFLGGISYPLYTIHYGMFVLARFTPVFNHTDTHPNLLGGLMMVAVSISLSSLIAWMTDRKARSIEFNPNILGLLAQSLSRRA